MKTINNLIPTAIKEIEKSFFPENRENNADKIISREYKSYISSFGSSVMQSGLLPALAFNHSTSDTGKKRKKVMKIIFEVLKKENDLYKDANDRDLFKYTQDNLDRERQIRKDIMNVAVAVKLAMRTFKFSKND